MYKPENPSKYNKKQIILNSGRLVFNAGEDSILLFSKKSIGLSSAGTLNFDSDSHFIVNSPKIYLGLDAHKEKEPLLLGNKTTDWIKELIDSLNQLSKSLSKMVGVPEGSPVTEVNFSAENLSQTINKLLNTLPELKSKQNFTI